MDLTCSICEQDKEVIHFPHIYIIGSEGCNLCLDCRLNVTELLQRMRSLVAKTKKQYYMNKNIKNDKV